VNREQAWLLPPSLEDLLPEDHPGLGEAAMLVPDSPVVAAWVRSPREITSIVAAWTPTVLAGDTPDTVTLTAGAEVFVAAGCVACHGDNGVGTEIAPALSGHSEEQVRRQARAPVGVMPVFPPDKISDAQLNSLVEYVTSLSGGHAHQMSSDLGAEMETHHLMAISAIEIEDIDEAVHHIEHVVGLTEGDHRAQMQSAIADLEAGSLHDAEHHIKEMLAGILADDLMGDTMHLKLALSSTRVGDTDSAIHHVEHFIGVAAGADLDVGRAILAALQSGNPEAVEEHLVNFLGATGVAMDMDMPMDMDMEGTAHDEAEEGHDDGTAAHDEVSRAE
jgi:mono/diheme cytochrome c family protein